MFNLSSLQKHSWSLKTKSPRTVETFENLRLWIRRLKTVESPAGRVSECYKHFGPLTKSIYKSCILINPISQSVQFSSVVPYYALR